MTGVNTSFGQEIDCTVQPIFRGSITSANVSSEGVGYGSSEILNFDRKPNVTLNSGADAQLTPIVVNGSITEVIVNKGGSGYNSPPHLSVSGGKYCKLTPILENGAIKSVVVVFGGIEYKNDSQIIFYHQVMMEVLLQILINGQLINLNKSLIKLLMMIV